MGDGGWKPSPSLAGFGSDGWLGQWDKRHRDGTSAGWRMDRTVWRGWRFPGRRDSLTCKHQKPMNLYFISSYPRLVRPLANSRINRAEKYKLAIIPKDSSFSPPIKDGGMMAVPPSHPPPIKDGDGDGRLEATKICPKKILSVEGANVGLDKNLTHA